MNEGDRSTARFTRVGASVPDPEPTFERIYREHADFVYRAALCLGVADAEADDVVHDVFIVVHRKLGELERVTSVKGWIHGITRRIVQHYFRGRARRHRRLGLAAEPTALPSPDEFIDRHQAAELIDAFLAELGPKYRIVFTLTAIEGLSAPEVAAAERIRLNTVYSRMHAAKRHFRRCIERWLGNEP